MESPYSHLIKQVETAALELDETEFVPERRAEELFIISEKVVQIFFISHEGKISTFSEPTGLRVFRFLEKMEDENSTPVFLQVGGWTHPLLPNASPCLEAINGAIMFPDVYSSNEDSKAAIGLILSDSVSSDLRNDFLRVLETYTAFKTNGNNSSSEEHNNLGKLGRALLTSASYVTKGLEAGTEKAIHLIDYIGDKNYTTKEISDKNESVSPLLKMSAKGALIVTHASVKVSGFVTKRVGVLTKHLANYLAAQATPNISSDSSIKSSPSFQTLLDGARGSLLAYGTIYSSLEDSALLLGKCIKDNSVRVVGTKYGVDSAQVFDDSLTAAGNAAMTYMNIQSLGVKGLVKSTAKSTGKEIGKNILNSSTGSSECKIGKK